MAESVDTTGVANEAGKPLPAQRLASGELAEFFWNSIARDSVFSDSFKAIAKENATVIARDRRRFGIH